MYMDPPMLTLSKNDGVISLMHCQDRNFVMLKYRLWFQYKLSNYFSNYCVSNYVTNYLYKNHYFDHMKLFHKKLKCEMIAECVAYTFEQSRLNCTLHTSTAKGQKFFRGKQTGLKKANYTLSLPEISYCFDKNRKRRCRREPKCSPVDCFRIALDFTRLSVPTLTSHFR